MKDSIAILLDDLSARLDCDVLVKDTCEHELMEQFVEIPTRTSAVADEIKQLVGAGDALAFAGDLSQFLDRARAKALEAHSLKAAIESRQEQLAEAQAEFSYLSAGRSALAAKVNHAMLALEQAQQGYEENELKLGVLERRIETDRHELSALRGQLAELTKSREVRN